MITFFILILSALAYGLGQHFVLNEVSQLAIELFSVFVFSCILDATLGLISIRRMAGTGRRSGRLGLISPLTFVGRRLVCYQEVISYRLSALSDQINVNADQSKVETPNPTVESEQSFYEQTLAELESSFKPMSVALILQSEVNSPLIVTFRGLKGKRLEQHLKKIYSAWFLTGISNWLGVKETIHPDFPTEELSILGIRYVVSSCFTRSNSRGILVLGFGSDNEPSQSVLSRLEDFTKRLEREIDTFSSFQELRGQVDHAEKISAARAEFLTHISHDIRSPLNNVKAILGLIDTDIIQTEDGRALVQTALRNCDAVADLVNSLIDFAKYRSGKLIANKSSFNLNELVDQIVSNFEIEARKKNLKLTFVGPVAEVNCFADKIQVGRVITNLIGNSIKYTDTGKINVSIKAHSSDSWILRIADSGHGFSESQLKEIFTPFTRFDSDQKDGVGLGLAVSKILSELNGGSLKIRSEQGVGSVFVLSIPSASSTAALSFSKTSNLVDFNLANAEKARHRKGTRLEGLRLLVVDDDIDATQTLARILAKEGAEIAQATTVPDAMSIINFEAQDVVITDISMPEGGGARLIKYIKLNHPGTAVVVVTGNPNKSEELIAIGAACVMDKPLHVSELIDYLEDVLSLRDPMVVGS